MSKMRTTQQEIKRMKRSPHGVMEIYDALASDSMREAIDSAVEERNQEDKGAVGYTGNI